MFSGLGLALGWRYAFSRQSTVSLIGWIALAGLALSVAVLVVVTSVINGFDRELRQRVLAVLPAVTLYGREPLTPEPELARALEAQQGVLAAAPFVQGAAILAANDQVHSVLLTGMDPADLVRVAGIQRFVQGAEFQALHAGGFGVILGRQAAAALGLGVGDPVTLVLPRASVTPAGIFPRQKRMTIVGLFESRSELDDRAAYVHLEDAQKLYRLGGRVQGYQLRVEDLFAAQQLGQRSLGLAGSDRFIAQTWMRTHGPLHRAIATQKQTMFLLLAFLVGVAAFNLVSSLIMVVRQRSGDIAILRTLGAASHTFMIAFVLLGLVLGGIGITFGLVLGVAIALVLPGAFAWLNARVTGELMSQYFIQDLPVQVQSSDLIGISVTALLLVFLSTWYPAWRAAQLRPAEVLAHE